MNDTKIASKAKAQLSNFMGLDDEALETSVSEAAAMPLLPGFAELFDLDDG